MIGPLGRLGADATLGQHCPQMTQRRCTLVKDLSQILNTHLHNNLEGNDSNHRNRTLFKGTKICRYRAINCNGARTRSPSSSQDQPRIELDSILITKNWDLVVQICNGKLL